MKRYGLNNNKHRVPMQIVQITPRFTPSIGGLERHVYEISKELAKRGHCVTILTTNRIDGGTIKMGRSICSDFSVYRYAVDLKVKTYEVSLSLLKKNLSIKADIFHSHGYGGFPFDMAVLSAKMRRIPLILTSHLFHPPRNIVSKVLKGAYHLSFGRLAASTATKCIALTRNDAEKWGRLGAPSNKIIVIPNGVSLEYLNNVPNHGDVAEKYHLKDKVVTFIGRLDQFKSPPLMILVRALKKLNSEFPGIKLIIIGPDCGYLKQLKQLVSSLKLEDTVLFTGKVSEQDKKMILSSTTVGVLLSTYEEFGIVNLEYMAFGKPVIASNVGGIPFVVQDGHNGILVENKQDSIESALRTLLSDRNLAEKIGQNGRKLVVSKYNWKSIAERLEKTYTECIGQS